MLFASFVAAAAYTASALAGTVPDVKRADAQISGASIFPSTAATAPDAAHTDVSVLQYATTLEHLENAFYHGALAKFDARAFAAAGFPDWVRGRFEQIAQHEAAHVAFLTKALGDQAPQPCEYTFPYTDPQSFAALSFIIEGVGSAAYTGAARFVFASSAEILG
jgi:hypothetical protein